MNSIRIFRSFSTGGSRMKEMRTRSYLDKWLGNDISGAPSGSVLSPKVPHANRGMEHRHSPHVDSSAAVHVPTISSNISNSVKLPIMSSKWVVANNNVASVLFVEEIEQQITQSKNGSAYLLDMTNIVIDNEADALKLLSILAENEKLSKSLLGFANCSAHASSLLSCINCALPCLAPDMSLKSASKSLLLSSLAMSSSSSGSYAAQQEEVPITTTPAAAVPAATFTYFGAVRSGQQVYSPGSASIIILGNVNNGGETLSDGDIHIYGKLLGRVICGLKGNSNSKIYCRSFEPALVGISDSFIMVEDHIDELKEVIGKPVCVSHHSKNSSLLSGQAAALRNTSNDSSSTSQVLEPAVKIPVSKDSYIAFTILP